MTITDPSIIEADDEAITLALRRLLPGWEIRKSGRPTHLWQSLDPTGVHVISIRKRGYDESDLDRPWSVWNSRPLERAESGIQCFASVEEVCEKLTSFVAAITDSNIPGLRGAPHGVECIDAKYLSELPPDRAHQLFVETIRYHLAIEDEPEIPWCYYSIEELCCTRVFRYSSDEKIYWSLSLSQDDVGCWHFRFWCRDRSWQFNSLQEALFFIKSLGVCLSEADDFPLLSPRILGSYPLAAIMVAPDLYTAIPNSRYDFIVYIDGLPVKMFHSKAEAIAYLKALGASIIPPTE